MKKIKRVYDSLVHLAFIGDMFGLLVGNLVIGDKIIEGVNNIKEVLGVRPTKTGKSYILTLKQNNKIWERTVRSNKVFAIAGQEQFIVNDELLKEIKSIDAEVLQSITGYHAKMIEGIRNDFYYWTEEQKTEFTSWKEAFKMYFIDRYGKEIVVDEEVVPEEGKEDKREMKKEIKITIEGEGKREDKIFNSIKEATKEYNLRVEEAKQLDEGSYYNKTYITIEAPELEEGYRSRFDLDRKSDFIKNLTDFIIKESEYDLKFAKDNYKDFPDSKFGNIEEYTRKYEEFFNVLLSYKRAEEKVAPINGELMKAAHELTNKLKYEYPNINYHFQLGLCISFLKGNKKFDRVSVKELRSKYSTLEDRLRTELEENTDLKKAKMLNTVCKRKRFLGDILEIKEGYFDRFTISTQIEKSIERNLRKESNKVNRKMKNRLFKSLDNSCDYLTISLKSKLGTTTTILCKADDRMNENLTKKMMSEKLIEILCKELDLNLEKDSDTYKSSLKHFVNDIEYALYRNLGFKCRQTKFKNIIVVNPILKKEKKEFVGDTKIYRRVAVSGVPTVKYSYGYKTSTEVELFKDLDLGYIKEKNIYNKKVFTLIEMSTGLRVAEGKTLKEAKQSLADDIERNKSDKDFAKGFYNQLNKMAITEEEKEKAEEYVNE